MGEQEETQVYLYPRQIQERQCCLQLLVFRQVVALRTALGLEFRDKRRSKATNLEAASTNPTPVEGDKRPMPKAAVSQ